MSSLCEMCMQCKDQYQDQFPHEREFNINCKRVPEAGLFDLEKLEEAIPDSAKRAEFQVMMNPVEWVKAFLVNPENPDHPLELRDPYQTFILTCRARKKVLRLARRLGKTWVLTSYALWRAITQPGCRIVFLTPYKKQVTEIFEFMRTQFEFSSMVGANVAQFKFHPHLECRFTNGSRITGFTSGSGSSKKSSSVRSADAHVIILDEADYLPDQDVVAIGALLMSHPDVELIASSTPSGRRDRYYKWCKDYNWKEFFYDSTLNPNWGPEMKREMISFYGGEHTQDYVHEVNAGWGSVAAGVFPKDMIEKALSNYSIEDINVAGNRIYCFGVDWNKGEAGTQIVIVGLQMDGKGGVGAYWLERQGT